MSSIIPIEQIKQARDVPNHSFTDWDSLGVVKSAIRSLEQGVLNDASQVVDAMRRDDRVEGCIQKRTTAIPSLPFSLTPGVGRLSKRVADEATEKFETMFSDTALAELAMWRLMCGVGFGELVWSAKADIGRSAIRWEPRLKVWHPRFFFWRWDTRSWWVTTMDGVKEVNAGKGQWIVFGAGSEERPWMHGKVRALYVPWLLRQWGQRDSGRYSEVYGNPFRVGYTPPSADKQDKDRFIRELAKLGSESIIRLPQASDGQPGFDVKLVEATGKGFEGFVTLVKEQATNIAITLLGQNLTTEVSGGSLAAARVHENVRADLLQSDADAISQALHEQALKPWAAYNFGSAELAPKPTWKTEPDEDKKDSGEAMKAVGEGIAALRASGVRPDVDEITKRLGIITKAPAEEPAQMDLPLGEKMKAKKETLDRLSSIPHAAVEGQLYVDELASNGAQEGSRAMHDELNRLLSAVEGSSSYADLKERLVAVYGQMDTARFAEVLQKAMILASLNGIHSVTDE